MTQDKQLRGVSLEAVLEKRRLDQALNAKEFAVLAGVAVLGRLLYSRHRHCRVSAASSAGSADLGLVP